MTTETLLALTALLLATCWTPGPNNALLAASGARFGFRATVPHLMGVCLGFSLMIVLVAAGLGQLFLASELLREVLRWGGALLMLWLAWRIATAGRPGRREGRARPFTFLQAAGFQWVNPKAWLMCVGVASQIMAGARGPADAIVGAGLAGLVAVAIGLTSAAGWTGFGVGLQRWLTTDLRAHLFNGAMAALMILSVAAILRADL